MLLMDQQFFTTAFNVNGITCTSALSIIFDEHDVDLADSTFQWPESGFYFSGLDVYHSLHCLVYTPSPLTLLKTAEFDGF